MHERIDELDDDLSFDDDVDDSLIYSDDEMNIDSEGLFEEEGGEW
jgi:hypothetical protein